MGAWFPAITSSAAFVAVIGTVAYGARKYITTWITKSVEHPFNVKLEELRTDLRRNEEAFKAELNARAAELQIVALVL